jgi:hypothetical protein
MYISIQNTWISAGTVSGVTLIITDDTTEELLFRSEIEGGYLY